MLTIGIVPGVPGTAPSDPERLARQAESTIAATQARLTDHTSTLADDAARNDQLSAVTAGHVPVLAGATRRLHDGRCKLENAIDGVEQDVATATRATAEADAILNQAPPLSSTPKLTPVCRPRDAAA